MWWSGWYTDAVGKGGDGADEGTGTEEENGG